jgi:hypothetical protein
MKVNSKGIFASLFLSVLGILGFAERASAVNCCECHCSGDSQDIWNLVSGSTATACEKHHWDPCTTVNIPPKASNYDKCQIFQSTNCNPTASVD